MQKTQEFLINYLGVKCFILLGFFSALISRSYEKIKNAMLLGMGISFMIEVSQMFTFSSVESDSIGLFLILTVVLAFTVTFISGWKSSTKLNAGFYVSKQIF